MARIKKGGSILEENIKNILSKNRKKIWYSYNEVVDLYRREEGYSVPVESITRVLRKMAEKKILMKRREKGRVYFSLR